MSYQPTNPNGSATSANSSPVVIASDQSTLNTSTQITGSATAKALGMFASLTAYGNLRVTAEPTEIFTDIFDGGTIDITNRWNAPVVTGMTITQSSGALTIGTTTVNSDSAVLDTIPTFVGAGVNFLVYGCAVKLEAQTANFFGLNKHRFFGFGDRPSSYNTTTPLKNAIGFEIDLNGQLNCVVISNGTQLLRTATSLTGVNLNTLMTPSNGYVRFGLAIRADAIIFYINTTEYPAQSFNVSAAGFAVPDVQSLPIRIAAVNNPSGTVTASTFQVINLAVGDTGGNSSSIKDGTYSFRKAKIDINGNQFVTLQDLYVTGQSAQTATVNNILTTTSGSTATDIQNYRSFSIQVISTATSGTFIFEGSNDNTNFQSIPVYNQALVVQVPIVTAITASSSNIIYTGASNFRYIRLRIASTLGGGSVQAISCFTQESFTGTSTIVAQGTAANLNVTATGTVTANLGTGGTGATSIGKAEDAVAASGDTGVAILALRNDALTSNVSASGDYIVPVTDTYGHLIFKDQQRHKRTYRTAFVVVPAASATDIFQLIGSATTTVEITQIIISGTQATAGLVDFYIKKRSTANTSGTSSASTNVPLISTDAAATAVGAIYTANPTTGTDVGNIYIQAIPIGLTTSSTNNIVSINFGERGKSLILSGVAQAMAINLNGVTVGTGSLKVTIEFTEY